ncbi:hypothetical protein [Streptomyces sp. AK02-01A]|uniref:hypothetical protein n=1 Tax=Streptomyces sp. AK02-01A TaxID=3028648 RepID=UPI0029ACB57C|nr:hypothetical protein [Streptomyces sp. AK02-01A]MDX3850991.1 hypothetical protein [Streptomyces sp. AK02-01A]
MACPTGNPLTDFVVGFFDFLGDPIGTIIEGIANAVLGGAISVFGDLSTNIPTLVTDGTAREVNAQTQWVVVYAAVASLLFAAIRMALERRGEAGQVALKGLLRVILVAGGATAVTTALAGLSDRYADHLFAAGAQKQLTSIGCNDGDGIQGFLLLVLAFLLLIAAIVQTIMLYVRLGVMIILLGTLPLAAAASMTQWGSGWWRKHIGWMVAWLLYKPAAGLVMFAGSAMISSGPQSGIHEKIAGIGVLLLSALALPALLKLVVPATAALGGGSAAQQGTLAAAGAVASGAKSVGGALLSTGGGARTAATQGPTGATGAGRSGPAGPGGRPPSPGAAPAALGTAARTAAGAAMTGARIAGRVATGALDGADPDRGHNS